MRWRGFPVGRDAPVLFMHAGRYAPPLPAFEIIAPVAHKRAYDKYGSDIQGNTGSHQE